MMDLVNQIIIERRLYYHHNIVPGHTKIQVNWKKTLLLQALRHKGVSYYQTRNYLFYFSREYFGVFETNEKKLEGDSALIPWEYITEFKVKKGRIEDALTFVYRGEKFEMQLFRVQRGQPWVSENIENLEENDFYYPRRFSE